MTNRYLTKISANRYETYLRNQPPEATFSNPKVQRAHKNIHSAKIERGMAEVLAQGDYEELVQKHLQNEQAFMQKNRKGTAYRNVAIHSPFSNTGDILAKKKKVRDVVLRVDDEKVKAPASHIQMTAAGKIGNPRKLSLAQHISKYFKKHPVKGTLLSSGALLGAGLTGYGMYKETKK